MKLSLFMVIHMFAYLHVYDVHMHTHVHTMEVGEGGKVRQGGSVSSDIVHRGPTLAPTLARRQAWHKCQTPTLVSWLAPHKLVSGSQLSSSTGAFGCFDSFGRVWQLCS